MVRIPTLRRLLRPLLALAVAALGFLAWNQWHNTPLKPRWTGSREGFGCIASITSGRDPRGTEVIIAAGNLASADSGSALNLRVISYAAADGKVQWERQYNESGLSSPTPLAIDSAGDVLIGLKLLSDEARGRAVIEKLAGLNGRTLWKWSPEASGKLPATIVPVPDAYGRVWVTGIQQVDDPAEYERFLALLNSDYGETAWKRSLDRPCGGGDGGCEYFGKPTVHPLKDGDALVLVPPAGEFIGEDSILIRVDSESGSTRWEHRRGGFDDTPLQWAVDEAHEQVITANLPRKTFLGTIEFSSLELQTGAEKWCLRYPLSDIEIGSLDHSLRGADAITTFSTEFFTSKRVDWKTWHRSGPLWLPEITENSWREPLQQTISARDGSLLSQSNFGERNEQAAVLTSPNQTHSAILLVRYDPIPDQSDSCPWRILRRNPNAHACASDWFRQQISGTASGYRLGFSVRAFITDSGKIVVIGDPARKDHSVWQVRVWE
jgi:hypothetical protein